MSRRERYVLVASIAVLLLAGYGCAPPAGTEQAAPPPRDGVFLHVSHGVSDPHRVLMALKMADLMSADRDVAMYFDIQGVQVVLKDSPDLAREPFPSSHTLIAGLLKKGVPVMVCPACLEAAGKTPDDVMDGVRIADKETFFSFTSGRILTLDY